MSLEKTLQTRSENKCECCEAENDLLIYEVIPKENGNDYENAYLCATCRDQVLEKTEMDANHWRCLNTSMWSEVPAVKVIAWRMLNRLKQEDWARDLLDMIYLEDDDLEWAKATGEGESEEDKIIHRDTNGVVLTGGDNIVLIKDLVVKGAGFTAKRGTAVQRIVLVKDNAEQVEGRVNGQNIVLLTQYIKKT